MSRASGALTTFRKRSEARDQPFGEILGIAAGDGTKKNQLEQLIVRQRIGSALAEALPQALAVPEVERLACIEE